MMGCCFLNGVTYTSVLPTSNISRPTKSCDEDNNTQEYTFRLTPAGTTAKSAIKGSVLLTVDKKGLCTEITACKEELKSNKPSET